MAELRQSKGERAVADDLGGRRKKHPGFKAVQSQIAQREGYSMERAGAILAGKTRKASKSARKRNPRLNRVKGY